MLVCFAIRSATFAYDGDETDNGGDETDNGGGGDTPGDDVEPSDEGFTFVIP